MKQIYSDATAVKFGQSKKEDIRGSKWTSKLDDDLQKWIKEEVKKDPEKWIAETVTADTNAEGKYIIQFNGTYGVLKNADVALKSDEYDKYKVGDGAGGSGNKWSQEQIDRLGKVAENSEDGSFSTTAKNEIKHINYDWMFVSTDGTDKLRIMTPYNNNYYTSMNSNWGIHSGWSGTGFGVGVTLSTRCILRSDLVFGPGEIDFQITNYDNDANTAFPGDVAQTSTKGLPYSYVSGKYQIVWYNPNGTKVLGKEGEVQQPNGEGAIDSAPFDTTGVTKTTEYTAKLHRVDSKGRLQDPIAIDSFTVEIDSIIGSRYDNFTCKNKDRTKGVAYTAENLPEGLEIDAGNGDVTGKPTKAGVSDVKVTASMDDLDSGKVVGKIEGTRTHKYLITDSPLPDGSVGSKYEQTIVPTPQEGFVFKNVKANFIAFKAIQGLKITGDKISGTPSKAVEATEETPNIQVTYDIYRVNNGVEVQVKKGHIDKVPLSIKSGEAAKYQPEYEQVEGTAGTEATVAAPTFKDNDGNVATPENVKYELGKNPLEGAVVNADGSVTYTPTVDDSGKTIEIPVKVIYKDGTTDEVMAPIKVGETINKSYQPKYESVVAQVGYEVEVKAPTYLGNDGKKAEPQPTGMKYALGDGAKEGITIDENTGVIKDTAKDADKNSVIDVPVVVTYTDGSKDKTTAEINVPSDADFYKPIAEQEVIEQGQKPDLTDNITNKDDLPQGTQIVDVTKYEKSGEDDPDEDIVDINTPGEHSGVVEVRYSDGTIDTVYVPIIVKPKKVSLEGTPNTLNPTEESQETGLKVVNKTENTTVTAEDEDGTELEVTVGEDGKVSVKPGTNVDGPITVTVQDDSLMSDENPEGTLTKEVPVKDHEKGKDDNNSDTPDTTAPGKPGMDAKDDGSVEITPPTDEDTKSIEVTYKDNDGNDKTVTATKGDDDKWSVPDGSDITVDPDSGKITIPADKVKDETDVTAKAKDKAGNESDPATAKAKTPSGGEDQPTVPTITNGKAKNEPGKDSTTVTGKTDPNTKVTVTDVNGDEIGNGTSDGNGNFTIEVKPKQDPGTAVLIKLDGGNPVPVFVKEGSSEQPETSSDNRDNRGNTGGGYWFIPANWGMPSVAKPKRETAIHKAYIYGYEDGTFRPEGNMTRAEAAAVLARLQGLDLSNKAKPDFTDVGSGWYNAVINAAVNAGYMKGYPDGTFRPDGKITRAEFAQMIKSIDKANSGAAPFADVKGHWAEAAIEQAHANGRITGYPDGTFRPNDQITRAEAVTVLNKLYDRSVNHGGLSDVHSDVVPFKDVAPSHWAYYEVIEASNTHEFYRTVKDQVGETWDKMIQTWKDALESR